MQNQLNLRRLQSATLILLISGVAWLHALGAGRVRTEVAFPDLPDYMTLRCDFHLHTVFSDGNVWPTVRVEEAWRDGLDAIAVTDHIEYQPHKDDLPTKHGRSYELAAASARGLGIILVRAAEITRGEPPGHLNALFLTNVSELNQTNYRVALSNAFAQGAFIFWNHPGWKQPEGKSVWYEEQGEFYNNGWLKGVEIVNGDDYDPIAHTWSGEKNLTVMGNSDAHNPLRFDYDPARGELRPMTLVFAKTRTADGIKEALFAGRTAVFSQGKLYGQSAWLEPLFQRSIEVLNPQIRLRGKSSALVQIRNQSAVDLELRLNPKLPELDVPAKVLLPAGKVSLLQVRCTSDRVTGEQMISLPCRVMNFVPAPGKLLSTHLSLKVNYD